MKSNLAQSGIAQIILKGYTKGYENCVEWFCRKFSKWWFKRISASRLKVQGGWHNKCQIKGKYGRNVRVIFGGKGNCVILRSVNRELGKIVLECRGEGNVIEIDSLQVKGVAYIKCAGNRCRIRIADLWVGGNLRILNGSIIGGVLAEGAICEIGRGVTAESMFIANLHSRGEVSIGDGCMISNDVTLMNSDSHPIYELGRSEIVNRPTRPMSVGRHVWLGMKSSLLKGVAIPDGCIVGFGAVVSRSVTRENCAIAGNPAKVVKENVDWKQYDSLYF